jgi:hypothetical protein
MYTIHAVSCLVDGTTDSLKHLFAPTRPLVTLDNNIVITIRNNDPSDPDAPPVRQLLALNRAGVITLNVTLSTALEEQRPDEQLEMSEYAAWLQKQGIAPGNIFTAARTIGFRVQGTPPNTITFDTQRERALNERIHQILFPEVLFSWVEYRDQECARRNIVGIKREALLELNAQDLKGAIQIPKPALDSLGPVEQEEVYTLQKQLDRRWMNAKNDALGLYSHLTHAAHTTYPERAVFVTNDRDFLRRTKLVALRELGFPGEILRPTEVVAFLCSVIGASLLDLGVE